jgi:hypothetical protein
MRNHVRILAKCFIVYFSLFALISVFGMGLIIVFGPLFHGDRNGVIGGIYGLVLLAILWLPGLIAGIGLLKYWRWARIVAISWGVVHLIVFPSGRRSVYTRYGCC